MLESTFAFVNVFSIKGFLKVPPSPSKNQTHTTMAIINTVIIAGHQPISHLCRCFVACLTHILASTQLYVVKVCAFSIKNGHLYSKRTKLK